MPSSYTLGVHFEDLIKGLVESGRYNNASEVVRDRRRPGASGCDGKRPLPGSQGDPSILAGSIARAILAELEFDA